jgi:hypothetical protein
MIAHDKRPGNTYGLQKSPRPREMLAKGRDPVGPRPRLGARVPACDPWGEGLLYNAAGYSVAATLAPSPHDSVNAP